MAIKKIKIFKKEKVKRILIYIGLVVSILIAITGGAIADRLLDIKPLDILVPKENTDYMNQKVVKEESVVISVVEEASPSVVTVAVEQPEKRVFEITPLGSLQQTIESGEPQDIGSGFIVSEDGLIVTNKHVVSLKNATYKVVTADNQEFEVKEISRDPVNDIAFVKIDATDLQPLDLGDSNSLKVGQFVIAIGTALGEFRHTVTTGVISGLGRGIVAGSTLEGYVEQIDNVIQTDAAINFGNSGGPLLNSSGQVIGINVAIASTGENVGFAIPVDVVKESLNQFKSAGGKFTPKAYLGVRYQMISLQTSVLDNIPQGAFVVEVMTDSPAEEGLEVNDIIIKIDGQEVSEKKGGLSEIISKKKPGDTIDLEIWRDDGTKNMSITLAEASEE